MAKRLYETAQTLVYDPVASNRNATRASLHSLGFRKVDLAASLDILSRQLALRSPDLLLAEVAGAEGDVCDLIQSIRQGTLGENPFMVMIATTWRRDGAIVGKAVNSGADDLVARPFSTSTLGDRIKAQVERRKGFVVTYDYIGPDRRRDVGRADNDPVTVPNTLRMRTFENVPEEESDRRIDQALADGRQALNERKVRRDAVQLCLQWRMLEQRSHGTRDFFETVGRVEKLAQEVKRRAFGKDSRDATPLCDSILASVLEIAAIKATGESGADYGPSLHLLGKSALGLGQIFAPGETSPAHLAELDAAIAAKQDRAA